MSGNINGYNMNNFVALVKYKKDEFFYVYNSVIKDDSVSIRSINEDDTIGEFTKEYSQYKEDVKDCIVIVVTCDPVVAMKFGRLFT